MRPRGAGAFAAAWVVTWLLAVLLAGAVGAQEPIRIGLQAPITGPWAYEGEMARNSVEIVKDQINARGGVLGRPIEIVLGDDQGNPRQSALVAQRMVAAGVVAVIGTYGSSINEAASTIYERAGVVNIAYGATAVQLTERGWRYFFRTCFRDDRQGAFFAQLVNEMLGASRVAILHDNTTFARGLAEAARASLAAEGLAELVFYDAVTPGERDFTPILSRMRARAPEVVYYTGYYPEAALIARQMRDLGIDALFVGGNAAINDEFVEIAGLEVASGALMTQEPLPTDLPYPEAQAFLEEYVRRHGQPPSSPWPVYAADALLVLAAAIEATGSTESEILAEFIRGPLAIQGITGPIAFDSRGDREGAIYLAYQVGPDGGLQPYEP
ncbi:MULTISPECIES: branched-chain amino acid ABC transporter substrate-binding protein [Limnochorda]|uniref:branched-chain amino acid ABC transporter substrate-binding protein n=1 Tax=Limnochorda TaxID=1676651 RepID=UPI00179BF58E|nr:branched-chain amino acid ABC transporter substrate-binding protein [Limnochorda pilosa]MBO2487004.1 branched chain amino acid ABC transporter substrate-binding protein [Bacillota bacterium]MBO2518190.1 branched chain amino acid ABC transporter substrate-binding protein [Bacillota bacterium]NMA71301.1 branched-chain amino acid ABC transporter substrate-binding protein [Bacillota bacterium]